MEMIDRGCGKYDYVFELGLRFPCIDIGDDGTCLEVPHYTCFLNDWEAENVLQQLGMTDRDELQFYKQESIIPVIEAFGLDKEKFWYAVVYVALLTKLWSEQKNLRPLPTALEQLTTMRDEIKGRHEFKVIIENTLESHSFVMAGNRLVGTLLVSALDKLIEEESTSSMADAHEFPLWRMGESYKKTEMTWYASNMFKLLFDSLNLPVLRSRNVKKEFRMEAGEEVQVKGRDAVVSYDKNQLIAELIHFLGLTDNPDLDGNSIKSILKSERKFGIDIF